jgi:hypothetical protein
MLTVDQTIVTSVSARIRPAARRVAMTSQSRGGIGIRTSYVSVTGRSCPAGPCITVRSRTSVRYFTISSPSGLRTWTRG